MDVANTALARFQRAKKHMPTKGMFDGDWQNWKMHRECYEDWADREDMHEGEFLPGEYPMPPRVAAIAASKVTA